MSWQKSPPALIGLFDAAIPADPRIERRKMFGYPAAFLNGHLFAGLHETRFILKLAPIDREHIVAEQGATLFKPMADRVMREYVVLPAGILASKADLARWVEQSIKFVASLPAKPKKEAVAKLQTRGKRPL